MRGGVTAIGKPNAGSPTDSPVYDRSATHTPRPHHVWLSSRACEASAAPHQAARVWWRWRRLGRLPRGGLGAASKAARRARVEGLLRARRLLGRRWRRARAGGRARLSGAGAAIGRRCRRAVRRSAPRASCAAPGRRPWRAMRRWLECRAPRPWGRRWCRRAPARRRLLRSCLERRAALERLRQRAVRAGGRCTRLARAKRCALPHGRRRRRAGRGMCRRARRGRACRAAR